MEHFAFRFDPRFKTLLRTMGVTPLTAGVDVDSGGEFLVRFGPWRVCTSARNVTDVTITDGYKPWRAIGPRLSLADRGATFGTNADQGLCLRFAHPVQGLDPLGFLKHPALTVTVNDPEGLAAALKDGG